MRGLMLAAVASLTLGACAPDEVFEKPPLPDLYKPPYDFGRPDAGDGGGGRDLPVPDLGPVIVKDLSANADLAESD